jgi:hypothetical protein
MFGPIFMIPYSTVLFVELFPLSREWGYVVDNLPYYRDVSLTSCLKLKISCVYTVGTQKKVEEP